MSKDLLTRCMEAGFPHLKQMTGLPEGLLPDFGAIVRQLGDEEMVKLADPLALTEVLKMLPAEAIDPDTITTEMWQQAIATWPPSQQVLTVTMALLRACEKAEALERRGTLKIDFALVRGLAIIAYAPFAPYGGELLIRLADILGGTAAKPAELLSHYLAARVGGDADTLSGVDQCIVENLAWWEWAERILAVAKDFPFIPRTIGITPPLTAGLKQVVVSMMKEVLKCSA